MNLVFFKRLRRLLPAAPLLALAACSSAAGGPGITVPTLQPASTVRVPLGKASKQLLYVSDDGTNEVQYFGWPKPASPLGSLSGFSEPGGGCADTKGDIWITNSGDENVLEYNGTKEVGMGLSDLGYFAVGCSFDSGNEYLAVSNIANTQGGSGNVALYKNAKGTPRDITVTGLQRVSSVQYDGSGDLFALGENASYAAALAEMKAGSNKFKTVCPNLFGGTVTEAGGMAWDGKYIVIETNEGLVRIKDCKIVGKPIPLVGASDIVGFTISDHYLVGADAGNAMVEIYAYPKGGKPVQTISGFNEPIGVAVSQNAK